MINEVSQMTNTIIQETNPIVKIRNIVDSYRHVFLTKIANDKELMEFLEVYPEKLSNNDFYTLRTKVYWVYHGINDFPIYTCPIDGVVQVADKINVEKFTVGYDKWLNRLGCSNKCVQLNPITIESRRKGCRENLGVDNAFQSEKVKAKIKQKNMENLGVEYPAQSSTVQTKMRETCQERYGFEYASQSPEIQAKVRDTNQRNNGVDYPMQSKDIRKKSIETCERKYGVSHVSQVETIMAKIMDTQEKRYGGVGFASQQLKEKSITKMIETYHVTNSMYSDELKQKLINTNRIKYGVDYPMQSPEIIKKSIETCERKYGMKHYSQTPEFHQKCHKKYTNEKYPDMTFGSSWEFIVYDFLTENHIEFEYQPSISFEYEYDDKIHTYHPDFKVGDKIYEVKGDMFFRVNESTGCEEMFCPYRYADWSDEQYQKECELFEAKHQCMLKNNVIILRLLNVKNLTVDMFK